MREQELLDGISSRGVSTPRLSTHLLESRPEDGPPVLFVHGNVASSRYFEETPASFPPNYRGLALDLRGFGRSEPRPEYCDLSEFAEIDPRRDVLWVHGADNRTVSDTSVADFSYLGKIGMVPNWPGEEIYPPQPMVSQIRALLEGYAAGGGNYREEVFADCGHTPHIEKPDVFGQILAEFLP